MSDEFRDICAVQRRYLMTCVRQKWKKNALKVISHFLGLYRTYCTMHTERSEYFVLLHIMSTFLILFDNTKI